MFSMCQRFGRILYLGPLNKHGFHLVFDSDQVILAKSNVFILRGHESDGMFRLNVMVIKPTNRNNASSSACMFESSNLGNKRLGHVNYDTLRRLIIMDHIPACQIAYLCLASI